MRESDVENEEAAVEEGAREGSGFAGQTLTRKPAAPRFANLLGQEQVFQVPSREAGRKGGADQNTPEQRILSELTGVGVNAPVTATIQQNDVIPPSNRGALHQSIMSQVRDGVLTHDGKGNGQMSIRLNPGELGELKIQVRMEDNRLKVEVQAENRMVKDLLMANLDTLKEALSVKNFSMERFNVSTSGGGFNYPFPEERGNPRQQPGHRFARGGGYGTQAEARVNYLTAEVNTLLDVRF